MAILPSYFTTSSLTGITFPYHTSNVISVGASPMNLGYGTWEIAADEELVCDYDAQSGMYISRIQKKKEEGKTLTELLLE